MSASFEFAAGSVVGRSHRIAGRNNQDAYCWLQENDCAVAIVCDGCGSGEQSEVGAKLGAPIVARAVLRHAQTHLAQAHQLNASVDPLPSTLWEDVRREVLQLLGMLVAGLGENLPCIVNNYFLFTVVGVLITPTISVFFALGDGVFVVNGEQFPLGPFLDNAPPYMAYGLVESSLEANCPALLRFQIHHTLPTSELQSFLIGTDGVQDLIKAAEYSMPGKAAPVGPLCQFWEDDRYFSNPDMIRRHLAGVNRDVVSLKAGNSARRENSPLAATPRLHKEAGLLHDDTTFIVGRQLPTVPTSATAIPGDAS